MKELDLLNNALQQYGMPLAKAELIRHNENMTYCIDNNYLLRIHKSKDGFNTASFYKDVNIIKIHENELKFLEHLKNYGICVQSPIKNIDNELVTVLKDGTSATMLTWLPGRIINKNDLTEELGYELGKMVGKIHVAAKNYHSDYFISYDQELCQRLIEFLFSYYISGKLDKKYYEAMTNALKLIGDKLKQSEGEYILLHSDLSLSNILITDDGLTPIDFSLLGYSNPMLDFGSIYCFVDEISCRHRIIEGYQKITGCKIDINQIDFYFALQILLGIVLHYELWMNEDWFLKRLPEWCNNTFIPLVKSRGYFK